MSPASSKKLTEKTDKPKKSRKGHKFRKTQSQWAPTVCSTEERISGVNIFEAWNERVKDKEGRCEGWSDENTIQDGVDEISWKVDSKKQ